MTTMDKIWAAFEAHKPKRGYARAWRVMLKKRTAEAAWDAYDAAPAGSVAEAAARAAAWATGEAWAAAADRYAQDAIDAIKEVKP
jgi:hypothetical protein